MSHISVNGIRLWVTDTGAQQSSNKGVVLMIHGFPDTCNMWKAQISALSSAGYRVIAPDLPGLGQSDKPSEVSTYDINSSIMPALIALLDSLSVAKAVVVGHDFGSFAAWSLALTHPERVERLVVLSVGYPGTYFTAEPFAQRCASWYIPFILLPGSEEALRAHDWALFRAMVGVNAASQDQVEEYVTRLSADPGALTAPLNLYRANTSLHTLANLQPALPPKRVASPVLGIHSDKDAYCLAGQMKASEQAVEPGCWHYKELTGVGHWMALEAPDEVNRLLLDFISGQDSDASKQE